MRIRTVLILLSLSQAICPSLQSQTVTNTVLDSPPMPVPAQTQTISDKTGHKMPPQDAAWLKSQGWTDEQIANAIPLQNIGETQDTYNQLTNYYHTAHFNDYQIDSLEIVVPTSPQDQTSTISIVRPITDSQGHVIPPEDIPFLKAQGYTDEEIKHLQPIEAANTQSQTNQVTLSPTPPDLKNAIVYMDSFLGMTNAMLPADVISMKPESLKFRMNGQDYDYSGNYTVMLNTPRQHKNPYFGFGSSETIKFVILEDFGGDMLPLQNATIWEKGAHYIDAVALGKEWIYSGIYTIQN